MKLKELASFIQDLDGFETPKIKLEQYETPAHIAARMIHTIESSFGDIQGKIVGDLGCGCGNLTIGAALLEPSLVVGFEMDEDALAICQQNIVDTEVENIELICTDVMHLNNEDSRWHKYFDTVVLNPPFGTKHNSGMDMKFLRTALDLSQNAVYSLHKTSTRDHISRKAKEWGVKMTVIANLRYNLPNTFKFHKKTSIDIEVDFIRFSVR